MSAARAVTSARMGACSSFRGREIGRSGRLRNAAAPRAAARAPARRPGRKRGKAAERRAAPGVSEGVTVSTRPDAPHGRYHGGRGARASWALHPEAPARSAAASAETADGQAR